MVRRKNSGEILGLGLGTAAARTGAPGEAGTAGRDEIHCNYIEKSPTIK